MERIPGHIYHPRSLRMILILLSLNFISKNSLTQPDLLLSPVITTGLNLPMQLVHAGDGSNRIFIVQKQGTIRAYDAAFNFLSDFVTVSNLSSTGERGLLSMAFHPDYVNNGLFFVYYTNTAGDLELARYQVSSDPDVADASTKEIVITIPHPTNSNHNGGELHFGNDGFLYLSTGDGGGAGDTPDNAQNTSVLLGKILRFDVNTSATAPFYTIPADNPFGNEIFNLGLRNPYRWSFDRQTNDMWIGDVGQDSWEEINFRASAATLATNYGWRCYEGNATFNTTGCSGPSSYVFPVHTYATQNPSASITGGIVYRGTAYPLLQGWYISADFYSGVFYKIVSDGSGGWNVSTQTISPTGIVDFGETENGEAFAVSLTANSVYRITVNAGPLPLSLLQFQGLPVNNGVQLNWHTAMEENVSQFEIEYGLDGNRFTKIGTVAAKNQPSGSIYHYLHPVTYNGSIFYRLKMVDRDGRFTYSGIINIKLSNKTAPLVSPSVITNGVIQVYLPSNSDYRVVELITTGGVIISKSNINGRTGNISVPANQLTAGVYIVRLTGDTKYAVQKIYVQ
ncbi:MAG: hypothetical protein JWM28_305 [Chitinophagaceae bacterium]|nr:hypothetical protein [Chitinophagaceae bacterium]